MSWVNNRDVAHLGPALLPHVAALGSDPALSAARNPPPSAPVYLLHGADDNVIPAVESALLAEDLRARGGHVTQLSTPLITHAEVDHPPAIDEIWRLVRFWAGPLASPGTSFFFRGTSSPGPPRAVARGAPFARAGLAPRRAVSRRPLRSILRGLVHRRLAEQRDFLWREIANSPGRMCSSVIGPMRRPRAGPPDGRWRRTCCGPDGCDPRG